MGMRPERAAIRIFCCHGSCVVGLRMWFVGADVICRRGCGPFRRPSAVRLYARAIPAAVGSAAVRKGHSGGRRQCDCTQGSFRRPSAVRLYTRSIPAAVGSAAVLQGVSPRTAIFLPFRGTHSTQMAKYNLVRGRHPTQTASNSRFRGI